MKILVTGSAGFIGFHLVRKLINRGDRVFGIDNINDYYDVGLKYARLREMGISDEAEKWHTKVNSSKNPEYSFIRMNVEDVGQLDDLFRAEGFDKVCHLAAQAGVRYSLQKPFVYVTSNLTGFVSILESCRHHRIKHLVYASSSSVYGNNKKMPLSTGDRVDHPISLYAATKKSNELMAHTYSHLFGLPTTGLRFFTVYGPWGRPDMALFLFTKAILDNKPIQVFNNGDMYRDFTYIDDIVEGLIRVIDSPPGAHNHPENELTGEVNGSGNLTTDAPYKVYNIGNSSPVALMEYISAIEKNLGKEAEKQFLPMQPGDVPRTEADVTDLMRDLNYRPETPVAVGIERFLDWYRTYFSEKSDDQQVHRSALPVTP